MRKETYLSADLFRHFREPARIGLAPGATLLQAAALPLATQLIAALSDIVAQAPFRHMATPGGHTMSVAMTSCGAVGWVSDKGGYRYQITDPSTSRSWPGMPTCYFQLAQRTAAEAGYPGFEPDSCLINRYVPGTQLSLHQDRDEPDRQAPIVSVSLGLPATFLFGGRTRTDKVTRISLHHGDIVVWGGASRLFYHGVAPLKPGLHPDLAATRINLTFRKAR